MKLSNYRLCKNCQIVKTKMMNKTVILLGLMNVQAGKFIMRDPPVKDMFYRRTDGDGWVGMINPARSDTSKRLKRTRMKEKLQGKINIFFQYRSFPFSSSLYRFQMCSILF